MTGPTGIRDQPCIGIVVPWCRAPVLVRRVPLIPRYQRPVVRDRLPGDDCALTQVNPGTGCDKPFHMKTLSENDEGQRAVITL